MHSLSFRWEDCRISSKLATWLTGHYHRLISGPSAPAIIDPSANVPTSSAKLGAKEPNQRSREHSRLLSEVMLCVRHLQFQPVSCRPGVGEGPPTCLGPDSVHPRSFCRAASWWSMPVKAASSLLLQTMRCGARWPRRDAAIHFLSEKDFGMIISPPRSSWL